MTIPSTPLVLRVTPGEFTLADWSMFVVDTDDGAAVLRWIVGMQGFLERVTNWAPEEIRQITTNDLPQVVKMLQEALEQAAVPLASETPSAPGRGAKQGRSRQPGR